ncbi:MORN repeat-containing protein 3, partial [Microplitis demolitor]|uniref:MORN repeat-containing protein 3 n=1 Tax=Microplitis demolitor TaxID=69319 RepID=UPI00235B6C63
NVRNNNYFIIYILTRKSKKSKSYSLQYEGQSLSNKPHGIGVLSKVYTDGSIEKYYSGNFVEGKKQGFGGLWTDNFYYEGDFCNEKRHGFGRIWYKNGSFYQGHWRDGLYDGDGMIIRDNGNRYEGEFMLGKKHGDGIYYHLETGQMQKGHWFNDICKTSTVEDICWRQSAPKPSPYPIPKLVLFIYYYYYHLS